MIEIVQSIGMGLNIIESTPEELFEDIMEVGLVVMVADVSFFSEIDGESGDSDDESGSGY